MNWGKGIICTALLICLNLASSVHASENIRPQDSILTGTAEDLWGNKIDLSSYVNATVVIAPFSPSNCGYCLYDEEFIDKNYFEPNRLIKGINFRQCLFNPQLDVYTYLKHYRCDTIPVLTAPIMLHRYHRDGFPSLIAFRNGRMLFDDLISPFEESYCRLSAQLRPGANEKPLTLTSPIQMTFRLISDNTSQLMIVVVPDGDKENFTKYTERSAKWPAISSVKYESDLSNDDLTTKHLQFTGRLDKFHFTIFNKQPLPFKIDSTGISLGDYTFSATNVGARIAIPNPYNRERCVYFEVWSDGFTQSPVTTNWTDYVIWRRGAAKGSVITILDGFFAKTDGNIWSFADSLACTYASVKDFCKGGICRLPKTYGISSKPHQYRKSASLWNSTSDGSLITLGNADCRFPSISSGSDSTTAVVWEEKGDIIVAILKEGQQPKIVAVECDSSDSFNPRIVWDGKAYFVAYLNNRDGYYRLYGKYLDGLRLSEATLISEIGSFDVVTPALASDGKGTILVSWSEWKANYRVPRYRLYRDRKPGACGNFRVVPSGLDPEYINCWYADFTFDGNGHPWGVWNQHYPSTLAVCAGDLTGVATSVTRNTGDEKTEQNGGYPSTVIDTQGNRWVFWESFAMDSYYYTSPQKILASYCDSTRSDWSVQYALSDESQTFLNQTPRSAIDKKGTIWVVWSGHPPRDGKSNWGIYLTKYVNGTWTAPRRISDNNVPGRAPDICVGADDSVWITWHSGVGSQMTISLLQCR